ncbi:MAG: rhodanese-like domain-containing protein [Deltaproteobacteria bacterium]|nr:rhodanese-like domain-containing protein [Deltaproteobacteria bacterium]
MTTRRWFVATSLICCCLAAPLAAFPAEKGVSWDAELAIPVAKALKAHANHRVVLVDVRSPADFERAHIPGSLPISLSFLKTKTYLKGQELILVGTGGEWIPLEAACRDLKQAGFRAGILKGGIPAWLAADGPIFGDAAFLLKELTVPPAVFYREKELSGRVMVFLGRKAPEDLSALVPNCLVVDARSKPEEAVSRLKRELDGKKGMLPPLVLSAGGDDYPWADALLQKRGAGKAVFVAGGLSGYRAFLLGLERSALSREERLIRVGGCPGCRKEGTRPKIPPGVEAPPK